MFDECLKKTLLTVMEGTSFSKGSEEGGQQSRQEQGDHSANPASDLLCNLSTGQQTQNPQTGEF